MAKLNSTGINYEEHKKLFEYAELSAKKAFNKFKNKIPSNIWSIEDFISEASLVACQSILKFKDKGIEDIFKLGKMAIYWKLQDVLQKSRLYSKRFIQNNAFYDENKQILSQEQYLDYLKLANEDPHSGIKFEDLTSICDDREYEIIVEKIKNGKSLRSIAKTFNSRKGRDKHKEHFTKQGVAVIYNKAMDKIRKIYFEE